MNINITTSELYTEKQVLRQKTFCVFLGLVIAGVKHMDFYAPDGEFIGSASNMSLFLLPPGCTIDFAFDERRINYVTLGWIDGLRWDIKNRTLAFSDCDQSIKLPMIVPVSPVQTKYLTDIFNRTSKLIKSATAANKKAAEFLMMSVLAEFITYSEGENRECVPEKLEAFKNAIDNDVNFERNLEDIMMDFDYSSMHLRRLFLRYYQTNPAEYRAIRRFARIRELLLKTELNFKEIADAVGMNNVTHLHSFVRKRSGMTLKQLRKNLQM